MVCLLFPWFTSTANALPPVSTDVTLPVTDLVCSVCCPDWDCGYAASVFVAPINKKHASDAQKRNLRIIGQTSWDDWGALAREHSGVQQRDDLARRVRSLKT